MQRLLHTILCWGICGIAVSQTEIPLPNNALCDSIHEAEVLAPKRIAGVGTAVSVQRLDRKSFKLRGISSIENALRCFSGVNLRDYGGAGGLKTVSVRGLGASHTVVAYDGLCVNDTQQGKIDMQQFSVENLESLELQTLDAEKLLTPVKNLAAAVIYLNTFSPDTLQYGFHGNAQFSVGSWKTWKPSLQFTNRIGKNAWLIFDGLFLKAKNNYPFTVENGIATQRLKRTNSSMTSEKMEVGFYKLLKKSRLDAKIYFYKNARYLPGQVILYVNENNEHLCEANFFGQLKWNKQSEKWNFYAASKWNWQKSLYDNYDAQYPNGVLKQHYWQREEYITAGASYKIMKDIRIAYATDYGYSSLNSNLETDNHVSRDMWLQSLSLQWLTEKWNITARGIAHLYWNNAKNSESAKDEKHITPALTASYFVIKNPFLLSLRVGYKESFRLPTFTENYYYHLGDKNLFSELSHQISAGLTLQASIKKWWPLIMLTVDGYKNKIDDRIVSIPYNLFVWRTVNMGKVDVLGIDIVLENYWRLCKNQQINFYINYSLNRTEDHTDVSSKSYGLQLVYTPQHSGNMSIAWENPWVSIAANVSFASERWCTAAHIAGTRLKPWQEYGMNAWHVFSFKKKKQIEISFHILNALNKQYEVIARYPMPGRHFKTSIKVFF